MTGETTKGRHSGYDLDGIAASCEHWHGLTHAASLLDAAELLRAQAAEIERLRAEAAGDAKLLWGLVRNVRGKAREARWSSVAKATGCGLTAAAGLCRRFGTHPDDTWGCRGWLSASPQAGPESAR